MGHYLPQANVIHTYNAHNETFLMKLETNIIFQGNYSPLALIWRFRRWVASFAYLQFDEVYGISAGIQLAPFVQKKWCMGR